MGNTINVFVNVAFSIEGWGSITPQPAAPTITSFAPASASVGATVTITGSGFTSDSAVTLNGVSVGAITVTNSTSITFTLPTGATTGSLTVSNSGGSVTSTTMLTVTAASTGGTGNTGGTTTPVSYGITLTIDNGVSAGGMSFVTQTSSKLELNDQVNASGPTISVTIACSGTTDYLDYYSEFGNTQVRYTDLNGVAHTFNLPTVNTNLSF